MEEMKTVQCEENPISNKVCQCCLDGSGELKSMLQEYNFGGSPEVYRNIICRCLFIQIPMLTSDPNELLICELCIDKLREIQKFRQQIEQSQRILRSSRLGSLPEKFCKKKEIINNELKEEIISDEVKEEVDSDGDRDALNESDSDSSRILSEYNAPEKELSSNEVLQKALERTKRNLQLLKNRLSEESSDTPKLVSHGDTLSLEARDSEPEDKKERRKYKWRKNYAKHIPFKLEKTDRTCKDCNETFPTHKALVMHMPVHYPNHICNHCGRLFILKIHLERHVNYTHDTERVECPTCKKLVKKGSLARHVRAHTGDRYKIKCLYCTAKFTSHGSKMTHMRREHNHQGDEYKCHICSKVFGVSSNLNAHIKLIHFGEKNHKCSECYQHFFNKHELQKHMIKHTQERNFECEVCHKRYGRKYTLKEHMKIHNNTYNFVCNICSRAFTQKCTLQAHIKTHDK